jgi:CheY-like chemotaxis protein
MGYPAAPLIVIAEDNGPDVILINEALRAAGVRIEIRVFPDGEDCVRYLRSSPDPPSAIILDLNLPRLDGFEVLRVVRGEPRYARVPVAVLTSSRQEEDKRKAFDLGANAFITKPSKLDEFLTNVGQAVRSLLAANPAPPIPGKTDQL